MLPFRVQVKIFLANPQDAKLSKFSALFQRWIQQKALDGMLIDVADYGHVFEGPGVVLIGHETDYSIENRAGRLGLLCTRKRQLDADLQAQLRTTIRLTLAACRLLEQDASFRPKLKFRTDELEIRFADRLHLPNRPETLDLVRDDVKAALADLYGGAPFNFSPAGADPRHVFTVNVQTESSASVGDLLEYLQSRVGE